MSDMVWRLAWALPLVCTAGVCAMLALRRMLVPGAARPAASRLKSIESLAISGDTRIHLIELDQQPFFVVESSRQATLLAATRTLSAVPARTKGWGGQLAQILERRK